jgi:hypothetical protein
VGWSFSYLRRGTVDDCPAEVDELDAEGGEVDDGVGSVDVGGEDVVRVDVGDSFGKLETPESTEGL